MVPEQVPREDPVVDVSERGRALVLRLAGELDLYNAPALREALQACVERNPERLVVDLGEVTFVDSTALGALVEARSKLRGGDGLALASPGLETRRALEISGLDRHLAVHESVEAALAGRAG
jgi:anti-sigma B factor antagonist